MIREHEFSRRRFLAASVLMGVGTRALAAPKARDGYEVELVGALPGGFFDNSFGFGIDERGDVVGESTSDSNFRAFLWDGEAIMSLGVLPGQVRSRALDIDRHGRVVGSSASFFESRAFLWEDGTMFDLGLLPGTTRAQATAINDHGIVVGDADMNVFSWQDGVLVDLGIPGEAMDVDNRGRIVGQAGNQAFVWEDGVLTILPGPVGNLSPPSLAHAISDHGVIVGASGGSPAAWIDGEFVPLPVLPGDVGGVANDINKQGVVVGESRGFFSGARAVAWCEGQVVDLNSLIPPDSGWQLDVATAVNDRGQVTGWGRFGGRSLAYRLGPAR